VIIEKGASDTNLIEVAFDEEISTKSQLINACVVDPSFEFQERTDWQDFFPTKFWHCQNQTIDVQLT